MYTLGQTNAPGTDAAPSGVDNLAKLISVGGSTAADVLRAKAGLPVATPSDVQTMTASNGQSGGGGMGMALLIGAAALGAAAFIFSRSKRPGAVAARRRRSRRRR